MKPHYADGPWEIEGEGQSVTAILAVGDNHYVCILSGWAQPFQDANARAIAAVPELIDALRAMYEVFGMEVGCENMESVKAAREALKKAGVTI